MFRLCEKEKKTNTIYKFKKSRYKNLNSLIDHKKFVFLIDLDRELLNENLMRLMFLSHAVIFLMQRFIARRIRQHN